MFTDLPEELQLLISQQDFETARLMSMTCKSLPLVRPENRDLIMGALREVTSRNMPYFDLYDLGETVLRISITDCNVRVAEVYRDSRNISRDVALCIAGVPTWGGHANRRVLNFVSALFGLPNGARNYSIMATAQCAARMLHMMFAAHPRADLLRGWYADLCYEHMVLCWKDMCNLRVANGMELGEAADESNRILHSILCADFGFAPAPGPPDDAPWHVCDAAVKCLAANLFLPDAPDAREQRGKYLCRVGCVGHSR